MVLLGNALFVEEACNNYNKTKDLIYDLLTGEINSIKNANNFLKQIKI